MLVMLTKLDTFNKQLVKLLIELAEEFKYYVKLDYI